jgi:hypothetical protein
MKWEGQVARMEMTNSYTSLDKNLQGRNQIRDTAIDVW